MSTEAKLAALGKAAQHDLCAACGTHTNRVLDDVGRWIYPAVMPDGKRINLLKVLQTNVCNQNCSYCANRCGSDIPRVTLQPDELARAFDLLERSGRANGLFLSSGIQSSTAHAADRMLATAELLRKRYAYRGYMHMKLLPGADDAQIEAALRVAQRVSINLEAPNDTRLHRLSGSKHFFRDLMQPLLRANALRQQLGLPASMTTQFVVGGADDNDREILSTSSSLYTQLGLARIYYSAFQPILNTPLENRPAAPAWREHRLYQADFLLRCYGFTYHELVFNRQGLLPRAADPKTAWALSHPERFPVEINKADLPILLRVPGIGPISAKRLIAWRRAGTINSLGQLKLAGADAERAAAFILLDGRAANRQLPLWHQEWLA